MTYTEWRELMSDGLRQGQDQVYADMEKTVLLRVYSSNVVPGFLQTPEYVRALLHNITDFFGTPNDVDQAVDARTARQRFLHEGDHQFRVIVEEQVLRHRIGDASTMREQLQHLLDSLTVPSLRVGIIPFGAERSVWPLESFYLYDDRQTLVENLTAKVDVKAPAELADYLRAFVGLSKSAVHGDNARVLIESALAAI
ncbi:DUF5753 domain-containing protein [Streptomyces sp. NPDC000075]